MDTTSSRRNRRPRSAPRPSQVSAPVCTGTCTSTCTCTLHITTHISTKCTMLLKASRGPRKRASNHEMWNNSRFARESRALVLCLSQRPKRTPLAHARSAAQNNHSSAATSCLRIDFLMRYLLIALLAPLVAWPAAAADPAQDEFVEKRVRPVFAEHCFECHGPTKQKSGLRLDSRAAMLKGGDNGPALVPKDPDNSLIIQAVRHKNDLKMPPMKPQLSPQAIADLAEWVRIGAPWPEAAA